MMLTNQMASSLHYLGATGRLLSPRLWGDATGGFLATDGALRGYGVIEDFRTFGASAAVASNVGRYGGACQYRSYEDTGDAIAQIVGRMGECKFTTAGTDNNESSLQPGGVGSTMGIISDAAGEDRLLIFEARVKFGQVTDNYNAFIGMAEESTAIADIITDAGVLKTTADFIGFRIAESDGDSLTFVYQKASGAIQTVLTYGTALVADTYYNLGFVFNPKAPAANRIKIFVNNVEQSSYVTATNIAAATFPDSEELQPLFAIKNAGSASRNMTLDGWGFYQAD